MDEDKLTFLTEVELPPYCFMSEAVEWVAFGRVPQFQHHVTDTANDSMDYRFWSAEMPDNFEPKYEFPWFDRLEFESLGIPVTEEYFEAADKCYGENVHAKPERIAEYEAQPARIFENDEGQTINLYKGLAEKLQKSYETLAPLQKIVDDVESQFQPFFDVAGAKLFQLLALGQITSQAINLERWERLVEKKEYEKAARFEDVPPQAFSLGFDWSENKISVGGIEHVALRVKTQDILAHRALLLQTGKSITVERFGGFYSSSNSVRSNQRGKVGRKELIDWQALKDHLEVLIAKGSAPDGKESCIFELIAYAERELGKSPSRSAVQRNMNTELDAIYARN